MKYFTSVLSIRPSTTFGGGFRFRRGRRRRRPGTTSTTRRRQGDGRRRLTLSRWTPRRGGSPRRRSALGRGRRRRAASKRRWWVGGRIAGDPASCGQWSGRFWRDERLGVGRTKNRWCNWSSTGLFITWRYSPNHDCVHITRLTRVERRWTSLNLSDISTGY